MTDQYDTPAFRRTRGAYIAQCTFDYFITILVSDAFFAKLLTDISVSDAVTGVFASITSFSFLFQLVSLTFADRLKNTKRTMTLLDTLSQLLLTGIFAVPFLHSSVKTKTVLVAALLLAAYFFLYIIQPICYKWGNSFVDPQKRGRYSAKKEMISLISGVFFSLFAGFALDRFESANKLHSAFIFIAGCMLAVCLCNIVSFMLMDNKNTLNTSEDNNIGRILRGVFSNRSFRNSMILSCLVSTASGLTAGFMGTYKTNDLKISVGNIQLINTAASLGRFAVSQPFGKFSDKHTYAKGFRYALYILAAGYFFNIFASPSAKWCVVAFTVLSNMSLAGTNQNTYNMAYCYLDEEYIVHGMAVNNALRGICGFLASLAGGKILSFVQNRGNALFGATVYGQQVQSAVSLLVTIFTTVFNIKVVEKQKEFRK
ncbi:MAG: MFS transporter [Clostridia bacterium]|nr:MFS transporter [Clostridia bacterium]